MIQNFIMFRINFSGDEYIVFTYKEVTEEKHNIWITEWVLSVGDHITKGW